MVLMLLLLKKKDILRVKNKSYLVNKKNVTDDAVLKSKVDKNTSDYSDLKTKVDKNTKNYEALNKKIDNVKPGTGLPPGDYVKKTDYDKDKATYVTKTDYSTDKNKLLSTDEYEKDKRDELALKKDLTAYTKKNELNTSVSTFLKSADASNPLKGYVEQKNFKYAITVFLRSPNADNPLHDYAKKSYVDDKVKNIKGGTQDLSGYTKQTDFIAFKDAANKNYATINQLTTLKSDVSKNYTLKKDLDVEIIKKELSVLMGRSFFNGIDGLLNEHIYAPKIKTLKFHSEGGGKVEEWKSVGENPVIIKSAGYKLAPIMDVNDNSFEMKFNGHRLSYGATSKFNSTVTNVYLVYKLNLYKNVELPKYPLVNSLFGAVRVLKKDSNDPEKWIFKGKGIAIDSDGSYSMGAQGLGRNVILFGVDNTNSKHPVNRSHDFMVLGNGNTQLVENVNSIPEKGLAINMTYPGKKFVLSIHYTGSNSLFYVNGVLMTVFKDKYFPDKKDHIGFKFRKY